jgi:hypothetical protein
MRTRHVVGLFAVAAVFVVLVALVFGGESNGGRFGGVPNTLECEVSPPINADQIGWQPPSDAEWAALGCAIDTGAGEAVEIRTGSPIPAGSCYTFGVNGKLVEDAAAGVALSIDATEVGGGGTTPVMFPEGWSARRVLGGVAVLDDHGRTVATTGQGRYFSGGYLADGFFACG